MNDAFNVSTHAEAAQLVDSLVAAGGGLVSYEFGAPGREIAVAAGAQLAADSGRSLTVIDFRHLLPQVGATIAELHPDLLCTLLPVGEAIEHPERITGGVLVVHTDLLHDAETREVLLARAGTADSLIVAARADVAESVLNALPGPRFAVSARDLMQRPGRLDATPGIDMRFVAVSGRNPVAELRERQERSIGPVDPENSTETVSFEEFAEAMQNADPGQLRRDIERAEEQQGKGPPTTRPGEAQPCLSASRSRARRLPGPMPSTPDSGVLERDAARLTGHPGEHRIDAGAWEDDIAAAKQRFIDHLRQAAPGPRPHLEAPGPLRLGAGPPLARGP